MLPEYELNINDLRQVNVPRREVYIASKTSL
jgi:hypothetical protein